MSMKNPVEVSQRKIERQLMWQDQMVLTYAAEYPHLMLGQFPAMEIQLNQHYEEKVDSFEQYCSEEMLLAAIEYQEASIESGFLSYPFEAMLTNEVTYNQNCAFSLYFDQYEFYGGAHGSTVRSSESWDMDSGRMLTLGDFFPCSANALQEVLNSVYAQIEMQRANGEDIYFSNYKEMTARFFNEESFYLTEKGIVLYYQQYEVAPYAAGIVEFLLPDTCGLFPFSCCKSSSFGIK